MSADTQSSVKMTHGLPVKSIEETLIMLMDGYPNSAWLLSSLCRKIFRNQEIRDSHKKALKDILRQIKLPKDWLYIDLRLQELDGVLYNMSSQESRKASDVFLIRSTNARKYSQLLKDELDFERKSLDSVVTNNSEHAPYQEPINKHLETRNFKNHNVASLEIMNSLIHKIDDL